MDFFEDPARIQTVGILLWSRKGGDVRFRIHTVDPAVDGIYTILTSAEFDGYVKMGKYRLDLSRGIAFKWEEG